MLDRYEIGLSGAIPKREPEMDRAVLEFVSLFTDTVLKYGGRIVHGCHPTFTPVILRQARLQAARLPQQRRPVTLVMSELWAETLTKAEVDSMTDIAELLVTKKVGNKGPEDPDTRNRSLTAMRRVLISAQNVAVVAGGMMHTGDGIVPGVAEEVAMAQEKGFPCFLVGGLGGLTRKLTDSIAPSKLNNSLSDEANLALFRAGNVAASVNALFEHLANSNSLAKSARLPVRRVDNSISSLILRSYGVDLRESAVRGALKRRRVANKQGALGPTVWEVNGDNMKYNAQLIDSADLLKALLGLEFYVRAMIVTNEEAIRKLVGDQNLDSLAKELKHAQELIEKAEARAVIPRPGSIK